MPPLFAGLRVLPPVFLNPQAQPFHVEALTFSVTARCVRKALISGSRFSALASRFQGTIHSVASLVESISVSFYKLLLPSEAHRSVRIVHPISPETGIRSRSRE